jgi:hypothetical protein
MLPSVGLVIAGLDPAIHACAQEERSSFLKKRTKKLLLLSPAAVAPPRPISKSFFASFFSKKEALTSFSKPDNHAARAHKAASNPHKDAAHT